MAEHTTDTTEAPELSVIIVTLEDRINDLECLPLLESGTFDDYEVIIRCDAGICKARNEGIKAASADKLVFIDDDAIPSPEYLETAARCLDDHAIVAGRVTHNASDILCDFAEAYDQGNEPKSTDKIVGCNMAFRREVFETVGYFDENIQWGHDETELLDRAKAEFDVWYDPKMHVEHPYASSIRGYWRKMWRFGPADVYYGEQSETPGGSIVQTLFGPSQYLHSTMRGTVVKSVGRTLRNTSIALAVLMNRMDR